MPNWDNIRDDFPIIKKYTYLANAAVAPIPKQVFEESSKFYQDMSNHGGALWERWIVKMEQTRDLCKIYQRKQGRSRFHSFH